MKAGSRWRLSFENDDDRQYWRYDVANGVCFRWAHIVEGYVHYLEGYWQILQRKIVFALDREPHRDGLAKYFENVFRCRVFPI